MSNLPTPPPTFPGRPDHPDFWRLADACRANDDVVDQAEKPGASFNETIGRWIDLKSVTYVALQRVGMMLQHSQSTAVSDSRKMSAAWLDGFASAMRMTEQSKPVDGQHRD